MRMSVAVALLAALSGCIISDTAQIAAMDDEDLCARLSMDRGNGYIRAELDSRGAFTAEEWVLVDSEDVAIGMSTLAVLCAWGEPGDILRIVTEAGSSNQWMYGRRSVIVQDGKVTAFQE